MKIIINPGHGGSDCGSVSNGLIERDVAFFISQRVDSYLQAVGYETKLLSIISTTLNYLSNVRKILHALSLVASQIVLRSEDEILLLIFILQNFLTE